MNSSIRTSLVGVIASMAVVNLVYGMSFPLMSLVLDQQGINKSLIGLSTVTQAAAILAVTPLAPRWLERFNPARLMQVCSIGLALSFLLAGFFQNLYFWFPLRFLMGVMTAMLWIASEVLINELSEEQWRGRVVALYSSMGAAGFALGPLLLVATGSVGMLPFIATALVIMLATMPLFLVAPVQLGSHDRETSGFWLMLKLAPVIMLVNVVYAASVESMITFFPLYGMAVGLTQEHSLGLMSLIAIGGMVLVLPLGWLADRMNRLVMLTASVALTIVGLLLIPLIMTLPAWGSFIYFFFFGGVEGMIYTLGVILVGQRFKGSQLAAATTAFTACWGVGTVIGPLLSGLGMDWFGARSLIWMLAAFFLVYLPLPLIACFQPKGRPANG